MMRLAPSVLLAGLCVGCAATRPAVEPNAVAPRAVARDEASLPALALEALHLDGTDVRLRVVGRAGEVLVDELGAWLLAVPEDERPPDDEVRAFTGRLKDTTRAAYAEHHLLARAARTLVEDEKAKACLPSVVAFLRSPTHQRLFAEEAMASTPEGQRQLGLFIARLPARPEEEERVALVRRLATKSGEVELLFRLSHGVTKRIVETARPVTPAWAKDELDAHAVADDSNGPAPEEAALSAMTRSRILRLLYTTRTLTRDELEALVAFWSSDDGRWYARRRLMAIEAALAEADLRLAKALTGPEGPPRAPAAARR